MFIVITLKDNIKTKVSVSNQIQIKRYANIAVSEANRAEAAADRAESVEQTVIAQGNTQVARVTAEGEAQTTRVTDEGDTQVNLVTSEGDVQTTRVTSEGDVQTTRVTDEGDVQVQRVIDTGDASYISSRESEAEALTSDSFAQEPEDIEVKRYYYDAVTDSILFNSVPNNYSSLHWSIKSGQSATGLQFQDTWDASTGAYPTQRPDATPLEPGDLFIVDVAGTIDTVDWLLLDWMIRNVTNDGWARVPNIVEWGAIQGVPSNVVNAITDAELQPLRDKDTAQDTRMDGIDSDKADITDVDSANAIQDAAIALNTAKVTGADRVLQTEYDTKQSTQDSAIALNTAKVTGADRVLQSAYDTKQAAQDSAIALNTAKVTGADRVISNNGYNLIGSMTSLTQAQYDAIGTPTANTLYVIVG